MSSAPVIDHQSIAVPSRPQNTQDLNVDHRDALIISTRNVDGKRIVVSYYRDDVWWLTGAPSNTGKTTSKLDFLKIPTSFRSVAKEMLFRLKDVGRSGRTRSKVISLHKMLCNMRLFFDYSTKRGVLSLSEITPMLCLSYVESCKTCAARRRHGAKDSGLSKVLPLSPATLYRRFNAIEAIHELSQYTDDPMPQHPWLGSSSDSLAGYGKARRENGNSTPLMSDHIFTTLFQKAWDIVQSAGAILDLRDEMEAFSASNTSYCEAHISVLKRQILLDRGWNGGGQQLATSLLDIRIACYVVIASLSGCRNQEISNLRTNAYFSTEDEHGELYWWMRSVSDKTDLGVTEWMIPEAAVTALRVMDRWVAPYQAKLREQIDAYRVADSSDVRIAEANEHLDAIFVGKDMSNDCQIRTLSLRQMNRILKEFAAACDIDWKLSSHQFRRKFANYAARSKFGDLRYLREHFKHWSLDMTLGYALNDSQEMALYLEIEAEYNNLKEEAVAKWLEVRTPLAGGYGKNLVDWRSREETITLFKSHNHMIRSIAESTAIRSNGHAWCTADDNLCDGNDINLTRCAGDSGGRGCPSAVIGPEHAAIYIRLYNELKVLEDCDDIGEGGRKRVARDLERCRSVLTTLGHDPLKPVPE